MHLAAIDYLNFSLSSTSVFLAILDSSVIHLCVNYVIVHLQLFIRHHLFFISSSFFIIARGGGVLVRNVTCRHGHGLSIGGV